MSISEMKPDSPELFGVSGESKIVVPLVPAGFSENFLMGFPFPSLELFSSLLSRPVEPLIVILPLRDLLSETPEISDESLEENVGEEVSIPVGFDAIASEIFSPLLGRTEDEEECIPSLVPFELDILSLRGLERDETRRKGKESEGLKRANREGEQGGQGERGRRYQGELRKIKLRDPGGHTVTEGEGDDDGSFERREEDPGEALAARFSFSRASATRTFKYWSIKATVVGWASCTFFNF
jgi:hypothetical protein